MATELSRFACDSCARDAALPWPCSSRNRTRPAPREIKWMCFSIALLSDITPPGGSAEKQLVTKPETTHVVTSVDPADARLCGFGFSVFFFFFFFFSFLYLGLHGRQTHSLHP
jgi:hypothetical protein